MKKKELTTLRQGDLLFVPIKGLPEERKEQKDGIIARGEVTGHTHQLRPGLETTLFAAANIMYIQAKAQAFVDHQEHNTITLPTGNWKVQRQREYIPDGFRQVAD